MAAGAKGRPAGPPPWPNTAGCPKRSGGGKEGGPRNGPRADIAAAPAAAPERREKRDPHAREGEVPAMGRRAESSEKWAGLRRQRGRGGGETGGACAVGVPRGREPGGRGFRVMGGVSSVAGVSIGGHHIL